MKRIGSILLLLIFCVSSFTFKTHYCYHHDGTRFHGDCAEHIEKAESSNHFQASFHEQKYVCHDIQLDKQYQQKDYSFKNFNDCFSVLPLIPELPFVIASYEKHAIPLFSCRGGPPLLTQFLRGPPLV